MPITLAPTRHDGDLTVAGHLSIAGPVAVTGSLIVGGVVFDEDGSRLVVGGNLTAAAVFVDGDLTIGGALTAGLVYCRSLPDIPGPIRARLIIEDDYRAWRPALGEAVHVDIAGADPIELADRLRDLLVPEAFDADGFDHRALFDLLMDGRAIFRST